MQSNDITNSSINKFLRRGGALDISGDSHGVVRSYIRRVVEKYIRDVSIITNFYKQRTVSLEHFKRALEISNQALASSKPKGSKSEIKQCKDASTVYKKITGKTRVKYQQNNTDCLIIPKATFKRYTKSVLEDVSELQKVSVDFLLYFQLFIEYIISDMALEATKHAKFREGSEDNFKVTAKDINMAIAHDNYI